MREEMIDDRIKRLRREARVNSTPVPLSITTTQKELDDFEKMHGFQMDNPWGGVKVIVV